MKCYSICAPPKRSTRLSHSRMHTADCTACYKWNRRRQLPRFKPYLKRHAFWCGRSQKFCALPNAHRSSIFVHKCIRVSGGDAESRECIASHTHEKQGTSASPFFFIDVVGCFTCDITAINGGREPTRGHKYYVVRVQNCEISERHWHCIRQRKKEVKLASRLYVDDDLYGHQPYIRLDIQRHSKRYTIKYITHSCERDRTS